MDQGRKRAKVTGKQEQAGRERERAFKYRTELSGERVSPASGKLKEEEVR